MVLSSSLLNEHRDHPALGIWTFIGNLLLMALISAAVRELVNRDYPLSEVLLFRYAQASLLALFEYLAMVFAAIVGFVFWGEVPVATTWIGGAIIAASGLFIFVRRQKRNPSVKPVVIE